MMTMRLKTRIALGGAFLFLLLALVGGVSFYHFNRLITDSKDVFRSNYESIEFSKNMQLALSHWLDDTAGAHRQFEENLQRQEANITEPHERELTGDLRTAFTALLHAPQLPSQLSAVQRQVALITQVNLEAISNKTNASRNAAERAQLIITVIITVCLLIGFTFIFNFPGLVAGPIAKFTEATRAIAQKDYSQRIHTDRKDEFGELADAFNNMTEQLDKYEHSNLARILFEKQRAETVIRSLSDPSIGIDNTGVILFANESALKLLNVEEAAVVGRTEYEVKQGNDLFRHLVESDHTAPFRVVIGDKENYFTKETVRIRGEQEELGRMITLANITPYKELDVAKTNFIATISHELKTPLASSDFSLKLLEDERIGTLNPEQQQLVVNLRNDNQRLLRILSELLDLSQVETGRIQVELREVPVSDMVEKAVQAVAAGAQEKGIVIVNETSPSLPAVEADPEKGTWILTNFLTNAIRYSPDQQRVVIRSIVSSDGVEIGVEDQGEGIDFQYQEKVFDRFFRVPGTKAPGTGLGLAISKDFAAAMGATIGVRSLPGEGSYFFCRFNIPAGRH